MDCGQFLLSLTFKYASCRALHKWLPVCRLVRDGLGSLLASLRCVPLFDFGCELKGCECGALELLITRLQVWMTAHSIC